MMTASHVEIRMHRDWFVTSPMQKGYTTARTTHIKMGSTGSIWDVAHLGTTAPQ
jgi:hypothetical protein